MRNHLVPLLLFVLSCPGCLDAENIIDLGFDAGKKDADLSTEDNTPAEGPDADSDTDSGSAGDTDTDTDTDTDMDADSDSDGDTDSGPCGTGYWGTWEPCTKASECVDLDPARRSCIAELFEIAGIEWFMPEGYCTSWGCTDDCFCGEGAQCVFLPGMVSFCMKKCEVNTDCRTPKYICGELSDYTMGLQAGRVCLAPIVK